ncbi:MAG: WecB/TagA/CpsF family glycosyltransferase [Acidobacteriaceae bacterium]|nr:WecB/TagA/CpsF family glycosyltransferase [Acidobacteriaceae bacterium]MBV9294121.1 WecB/TagA/CpsF family glycosyltransferase [Acidobacteriaceae bacterium]MBV9765977.1 WecB/TagA/CpsF family glycosyltransferase [Acidobacteriaceae bacterium]
MSGAVPDKQLVVSVGISKTSYAEVVELCRQWAIERKSSARATARYICVTSVHGIIMARDNPELAKIFEEADIVTPDGMPVVWALRSFGSPGQQRVYGPTLMLELCRRAAESGHKIFLYGGREGTLPTLVERLCKQFPGLIVAGYYSPPFRTLTKTEDQAVRERIVDSDADIVLVGISTPKQEQWMYDHRNSFPGVTLIGVGAAFDFHAGRIRQAPDWMRRKGLEWLFRLAIEPVRLWKRYLWITPRFLPLWAWQKWRMSGWPGSRSWR